MGRHSTGAITTGEARRIEMRYLLREGYIQKGLTINATLYWTCSGQGSGSAGIKTVYQEDHQYMELSYTITDNRGNKKEISYRVILEAVPSNLGKGEILYFSCPETGRRCRVLYMAYGSEKFKSREAYRNRIYYPLQVSSKLSIHMDRAHQIGKILERIEGGRPSYEYNGRITRRRARIERLREKMDEADWLSLTLGMGKRLTRLIQQS